MRRPRPKRGNSPQCEVDAGPVSFRAGPLAGGLAMSKYLTGLVGLALVLSVVSSADALNERPIVCVQGGGRRPS
jgi:hypothetical protein